MLELKQVAISPTGYLIITITILLVIIAFIILSTRNIIESISIVGWRKAYLPRGLVFLLSSLIITLLAMIYLIYNASTKNLAIEKNELLTFIALIMIAIVSLYYATREIYYALEHLTPSE